MSTSPIAWPRRLAPGVLRVSPSTLARDMAWVVQVLARSGLLGPYGPRQLLWIGLSLLRYGPNLGAMYALGAARHPDRPAVIDERGSLTFAQMEERTSTLAAALSDMGLGPRSQVGILCRNHAGFLATLVALGKLGADIVYFNTGFAAPQLAASAAAERVDAVVCDQDLLDVVAPLERRGLPVLVAWADEPGSLAGRRSLDAVWLGPRRPAPPPPRRIGRHIVLTSGTTGTPKGARRRLEADLRPLLSILSVIPLRSSDTTLIAAPMFHSWGLAHAAFALLLGSTVVTARRFEPEAALAAVEANRVSVLVAVPVMLQRILDLGDEVISRYDASSLRVVAVSGSTLPGDLAGRFMDRFGEVLYNLYGSTEVGWASVASPSDLRQAPGTAGRVPPGTQVRILDGEGRPLPPGQSGRIFVRSALLFEEYTGGGGKQVEDGFMATGDLGHFDQAGRLFVDGRDDDMIVSGGENVYPREIEDLLAAHPGVAEVAVVGVADEEFGQRLEACVVARPGQRVDEEQLKDYVRQRLARYKVPRRIIFVDSLPRNATGKVLRSRLPLGA